MDCHAPCVSWRSARYSPVFTGKWGGAWLSRLEWRHASHESYRVIQSWHSDLHDRKGCKTPDREQERWDSKKLEAPGSGILISMADWCLWFAGQSPLDVASAYADPRVYLAVKAKWDSLPAPKDKKGGKGGKSSPKGKRPTTSGSGGQVRTEARFELPVQRKVELKFKVNCWERCQWSLTCCLCILQWQENPHSKNHSSITTRR